MLYFLLFGLFLVQANAVEGDYLTRYDRQPSYPYLNGNGLRRACDVIFIEESHTLSKPVEPGDLVFVMTHQVPAFIEKAYPTIHCPFILVSHNCDHPNPGFCRTLLDSPHLIAWLATNLDGYDHPKLHPIPFGIANSFYSYGHIPTFEKVLAKKLPKSILLYMNISFNHPERKKAYNYFIDKPFCKAVSDRLQLEDYLDDIARAKFIVSPRGNGEDCFRTWEALLFGTIPIVKSSPLNPVYEHLPIIIVKEWEEVTEEFLEKKWEEMSSQTFRLEKMYAPYWIGYIRSFKTHFLERH